MRKSVRDLMAPAVVSLPATATVEAARALMHAHGVHALPVVDEQDQPLGILTSSDLVDALPATLPVQRVMTRAVVEVSPDGEPEAAARAMVSHRIHHLLVTERGRLVGVLSALDLLPLVRPSKSPTRRK